MSIDPSMAQSENIVPPLTLGEKLAAGWSADVRACDDNKAIKIFHDWVPEGAIIAELRNNTWLNDSGLPKPRCFGRTVLDGRRAIVFERVEGLPFSRLLRQRPDRFLTLVRRFAATHRKIHTVHDRRLPSLHKRLQKSIERAPQLDSAQQGRLIDLLRSLPRGDSVCHCDFHSENVLAGKSGVAVVDWIAAACGNPLADVARTYVLHVAYDKPTGALGRPISRLLRKLFLNAYMKSYFGGQSQPNHEELERWIAVVAAAKLGDRAVSQSATLMTLVERGLGRMAVDRPAVPRS